MDELASISTVTSVTSLAVMSSSALPAAPASTIAPRLPVMRLEVPGDSTPLVTALANSWPTSSRSFHAMTCSLV